jgi:transposase
MYWERLPMAVIAKYTHRDRRTVRRWIVKYLKSGSPTARVYRRGPRVSITSEMGRALEDLLENEPDMYLFEMVRWFDDEFGFKTTASTVCNYLVTHLKLTRKKVRLERGFTETCQQLAKRAQEQKAELVAQYMMMVAPFNFNQFVFLDEVAKDERAIRRLYGRSPKGGWSIGPQSRVRSGRAARRDFPFVRGDHLSGLAALNQHGICAYRVIEGAYDAETMLEVFHDEIVCALSCTLSKACAGASAECVPPR